MKILLDRRWPKVKSLCNLVRVETVERVCQQDSSTIVAADGRKKKSVLASRVQKLPVVHHQRITMFDLDPDARHLRVEPLLAICEVRRGVGTEDEFAVSVSWIAVDLEVLFVPAVVQDAGILSAAVQQTTDSKEMVVIPTTRLGSKNVRDESVWNGEGLEFKRMEFLVAAIHNLLPEHRARYGTDGAVNQRPQGLERSSCGVKCVGVTREVLWAEYAFVVEVEKMRPRLIQPHD